MGWPGRVQLLLCWAVVGAALRNAILLRAAGPYIMARPFRAGYRSGWSGNHGPAADGRAQATDAKLAAQPVRLRVGSLHAPTPHPERVLPPGGEVKRRLLKEGGWEGGGRLLRLLP